jgi:ABC-2 type transport system ATP-binding protein
MSLIIKGLSKKYDAQIAVEDLSFSIDKGSVVGFLGPNGAGKSTTLKMIAGFLAPDKGEIILNGISNQKEPIAFKKKVGYLPESNPLYEDMYVKEYFSFLAAIHKINQPSQRIEEVIYQTGLTPMQHKKIGALSKGFKQRLGIAAAIMHKPALVLLDEPTTGLDPNQLIEIRKLIQNISSEAIVLFSSHILQEVAAICSRVLVIHAAKLVANTLMEDLLKPTQPTVLVVFEESIEPFLQDDFFTGISYDCINKHSLVIKSNELATLKKNILGYAFAKGLNIRTLQTQEVSLEEIFKFLTQ